MTFDDPWLNDDDTMDILDRTCLVEIPSAVIQTSADAWGLGSAVVTATPDYQSLPCMEIPRSLYIDRVEGVTKSVSVGLVILDAHGLVNESTRIQFDGRRYQVKEVVAPLQHKVKRVVLAEISGGN